MALIDELKEKQARIRAEHQESRKKQDAVHREMDEQFLALNDLARAIAALEAPAQPVHPEAELRSVPGAEEEVRDQFEMPSAYVDGPTYTTDNTAPLIDAQTCEAVDPRCSWKAEPEIPEGFTKWEGGHPANAGITFDMVVEIITRNGSRETQQAGRVHRFWWEEGMPEYDVIAYRIIEAPAAEQPASVEIEPTTDLWQQGYNDKLNGFEPSLAEPEYTKGYEARALIEREHSETMERAKFFEGGMMADADRHQSDQRSIVEKIGGLFKREKEDA